MYLVPFSYSSGYFTANVPPGPTTVLFERGLEHDFASATFNLVPGQLKVLELASGRFVDMRAYGWISGETHVHWVKNWWYENEELALLELVQRAADLRVINNLTLRYYDPFLGLDYLKPDQRSMGTMLDLSDGDYVVHMGEEFRNDPFYGHLTFLNLARFNEAASWPSGATAAV